MEARLRVGPRVVVEIIVRPAGGPRADLNTGLLAKTADVAQLAEGRRAQLIARKGASGGRATEAQAATAPFEAVRARH